MSDGGEGKKGGKREGKERGREGVGRIHGEKREGGGSKEREEEIGVRKDRARDREEEIYREERAEEPQRWMGGGRRRRQSSPV